MLNCRLAACTISEAAAGRPAGMPALALKQACLTLRVQMTYRQDTVATQHPVVMSMHLRAATGT